MNEALRILLMLYAAGILFVVACLLFWTLVTLAQQVYRKIKLIRLMSSGDDE